MIPTESPTNGTTHANPNGTPNYIKALLTPRTKGTGRKVWSIDLQDTWLPFFTATNVMGETHLPADALGAPLRIARNKDGELRLSTTGRPVLRVAPELNTQIGIVRENFVASLQDYAGMVADERPDAYRDQVAAAQAAGEPINQAAALAVAEAIAQAAAPQDTTPAPSDAPAAARRTRQAVRAAA